VPGEPYTHDTRTYDCGEWTNCKCVKVIAWMPIPGEMYYEEDRCE